MMTLPYGVRTGKLSTGERIDIPNIIRNFGIAETIRQYRAYKTSIGEEDRVMSDSMMTRMMNAFPATTRHSLTCVDSFRAAGYQVFYLS